MNLSFFSWKIKEEVFLSKTYEYVKKFVLHFKRKKQISFRERLAEANVERLNN